MRRRLVIYLAAVAVASFLLLREQERGGLREVDETYVAFLRGNSPALSAQPETTFVFLSDEQAQFFDQWPLSQLDLSTVVSAILEREPATLAIHSPLDWKEVNPLADSAFVSLLIKTPRLILGGAVSEDSAGKAEDGISNLESRISEDPEPGDPPESADPAEIFPELTRIEGDVSQIPPVNSAFGVPSAAYRRAGYTGFTYLDLFDVVGGRDTLRIPLLARAGEKVIPSLALHAAALHAGAPLDDVRVIPGKSIEITPGLRIPIDEAGAMRAPLALRGAFPAYNAETLFGDEEVRDFKLLKAELIDPEDFHGRLVLLGVDTPSTRPLSLPGGEALSYAELNAIALTAIQGGRFEETLAPPVQYAVWTGAFLVGFLVIGLRRFRGLVIAIGALVSYLAGSIFLFQGSARWTSPAIPLTLLLLALLIRAFVPDKRPVAASPGQIDPQP